MMPNAIHDCGSGNGDASSENLPDRICTEAVSASDRTKSNTPGNLNASI
jgi:hypothetical protein